MPEQKPIGELDAVEDLGTRVVIQGIAGSFHHLAARRYFGNLPLEIVPASSFPLLVKKMEQRPGPDFALMAIENSVAGSLLPNYQLLYDSDLVICGEVYLRISQNLLGTGGGAIADLREVYSHPMAIAQSRLFFERYPHIRLIEAEDTAGSARWLADHPRSHIGVIASRQAAVCYGLQVLASGIETHPRNYTRFLVLRPKTRASLSKGEGGHVKISLSFDLAHEVGSLHRVLAGMASFGANLTQIQSSPILGRPWEYRFFADLLLSGKAKLPSLLGEIEARAAEVTVLGVYKAGNHYEEH